MRRVVWTFLFYPPTWIAILTVLVIEWAAFGRFSPSLFMTAVLLSIGLALLLIWPLVLIASGSFALLYYGLPTEMKGEDTEKLKLLAADLESVGSDQGIRQLSMLREKLDSLVDVLNSRLQAGELTYGRYFGTAEQVYLSAIDNLSEVVVARKSVSSIDRGYIDDRLTALREGSAGNEDNTKEVASLESRKELLDRQMKKVSELVAQNEEAMTVLDKTATALADTRTAKGRASVNADEAMAELELLAKRAGKYASAGARDS